MPVLFSVCFSQKAKSRCKPCAGHVSFVCNFIQTRLEPVRVAFSSKLEQFFLQRFLGLGKYFHNPNTQVTKQQGKWESGTIALHVHGACSQVRPPSIPSPLMSLSVVPVFPETKHRAVVLFSTVYHTNPHANAHYSPSRSYESTSFTTVRSGHSQVRCR